MRCAACGRPEAEPGCRMCHFIVDHMDDLDSTVVFPTGRDRLKHQPAPWEIRPTLKADLLEAWQRYPDDPHNA